MVSYLFLGLRFPSGSSLGPSRTAILEAIDILGSISAAARALSLSYRGTWNTVQELNNEFRRPLVEMRVGGPKSGAALTPFGKQVVAHFRAVESAAQAATKNKTRAFERFLEEDMQAPAPVPRWAQVPSQEAKKPAPPRIRRNKFDRLPREAP